MNRRTILQQMCGYMMFSSCAAIAGEKPYPYDVPFVVTPMFVVDKMLNVADVGKKDIVYDLGCGDGRIVVAAAQRGAKAIGIDIDPQRLMESRKNITTADVYERAEVRRGDIFAANISEATVVSMFLLPDVNLKLMPKLFSECAPGTRIVSHMFDMGLWPPDIAEVIDEHRVYMWTIPANVSGQWDIRIPQYSDQNIDRIQIFQQFQEVTGTIEINGYRIPLDICRVRGNVIQFSVRTSPMSGTIYFSGIIEGNDISGNASCESWDNRLQWNAQRNPQTITDICRPGPYSGI